MGCGSSVANDAESSRPIAAHTGPTPSVPPTHEPLSVKPSSCTIQSRKKTSTSTDHTPCFTSTTYRRTSEEEAELEAEKQAKQDAASVVTSLPTGATATSQQQQQPDGSVPTASTNIATARPSVVLAAPAQDDILLIQSLSDSSSSPNSAGSSSSSDSFGGKPSSVSGPAHLSDVARYPTEMSAAGGGLFAIHKRASGGGGSTSMEPPRGMLAPTSSGIYSGGDEAVGALNSSRLTSASLMSDPELNESFDGRLLNDNELFDGSARPTSGLATFADTRHECAACGSAEVAYACEQCDTCWCEDCRFKPSVFESHPPDHTINALHDAQHCSTSRTFAESSFCSTDATGTSVGGGGASTLLYNPCYLCQSAINDIDVVHRCGQCDFIACAHCFLDGKVAHEHPLQRFQRRTKNTVTEKPLMLKKKTSDGNRIINDYVVVRLLGRGGNAKVKLVQHIPTRQLFALKILKRPKVSGVHANKSSNSETTTLNGSAAFSGGGTSPPPQPGSFLSGRVGGGGGGGGGASARGVAQPTLEDLLREIAVMKFIDHPNIVRLREVIEDTEAQRAYIIMEYCEQGPIYTNGDPPLPKETVQQYATDILRGLQHLHSQYLYHRDIKPANCLVDGHGTVKITDFGTTNSNVTSGQTGTLAYCCPEERKCEAYTGDVKDSWAFAITLYQLAYGRLPFDSLDVPTIRQALASPNSFDFPRETDGRVDRDLINLLERMLCKDLSQRMLVSTAGSHPYFADQLECSLSASDTPVAPGRQQLQRGSVIGSFAASPCGGGGGSHASGSASDSDAERRNRELYARATASVVRGRNLLDAFHGTKSIQRVRQREVRNAQRSATTRAAIVASNLGAHGGGGGGGGFGMEGEANGSSSGGNEDAFEEDLALLESDDSIDLGEDETQSNVGTLRLDGDECLQVDRSLPSLMSRSQSMPVTVAGSTAGRQRSACRSSTRTTASAVVRTRATFAESMTPPQQETVLEMIRQYIKAPEKTRRVLRVSDTLMLSPPSAEVESVADTAIGLYFSRTAMANLGAIDLSRFNALKDVTLSSNRLTEIPEAVLDAPRLLRLDLSDNRIRHIPPSLPHARFLQRLNLHGNNISEVGVDVNGMSCFSSTCLRHVRLSSNPMKALPERLDTTTKLELVLDSLPALTEAWEQVVTQSRPNPPPAVITWDDSFPQALPALPVPVWVATAPLMGYRSHILKACGARHLVIPRSADARFPAGLHQGRTLEVYFKRLLRAVFGFQRAEIVASSPRSAASPPQPPTDLQLSAVSMRLTLDAEKDTPMTTLEASAAASPEQTALAAAAVAENWGPLPSVVGKAARAYVASYFFVPDPGCDDMRGGTSPSSGSSTQQQDEGGFEDLRKSMAQWLKAGESFLFFVPQGQKELREELTITLGLALEDAFGEEWGEAKLESWLDTYGVL